MFRTIKRQNWYILQRIKNFWYDVGLMVACVLGLNKDLGSYSGMNCQSEAAAELVNEGYFNHLLEPCAANTPLNLGDKHVASFFVVVSVRDLAQWDK